MKYKIDQEIKSIMTEAYKKSQAILKEHKVKLDQVAAALIEKETLEADEFADIMKNGVKERKKIASKATKAD